MCQPSRSEENDRSSIAPEPGGAGEPPRAADPSRIPRGDDRRRASCASVWPFDLLTILGAANAPGGNRAGQCRVQSRERLGVAPMSREHWYIAADLEPHGRPRRHVRHTTSAGGEVVMEFLDGDLQPIGFPFQFPSDDYDFTWSQDRSRIAVSDEKAREVRIHDWGGGDPGRSHSRANLGCDGTLTGRNTVALQGRPAVRSAHRLLWRQDRLLHLRHRNGRRPQARSRGQRPLRRHRARQVAVRSRAPQGGTRQTRPRVR